MGHEPTQQSAGTLLDKWCKALIISPMALRPRPTFHQPSWEEPDIDEGPDRPSRTHKKEESEALQVLGKSLASMPAEKLKQLHAKGLMEDRLFEALRAAPKIKGFESQRRHMQYIGKLMRKADPEPLQEAWNAYQLGITLSTLHLHQMEQWRARLIASDVAVDEWMAEFPQSDRQHLRSLVRAARKDAAIAPEQRSGRAFREIFQFVKETLESQANAT